MLRHFRKVYQKNSVFPFIISHRGFLSSDYKCTESWNSINSSPIIQKINLGDFYSQLDTNYSSKGSISAIDVDIFAHAVNETEHLDELKDLLLKLRLSAETGSMLESTHHATIRNFIKYGYIQEIVDILRDPLTFGVFLDEYSANLLLDDLLKSQKYELAANVASLIMLQEEFGNELTCSLCQYACYKFIITYTPPEPTPAPEEPKKKKVEEIKIRIKFLRNPYFDDHFDIKDPLLLAGKTLAWISEQRNNNLNSNLQIIGWSTYKKYDQLLAFCNQLSSNPSTKTFPEVISHLELLKTRDTENAEILDKCLGVLTKVDQNSAEVNLEESLKIMIENSINKVQKNDISMQEQLFKSWVTIREERLAEQTKRLDRAKRMQLMQEKQQQMQVEEQKLWFFENEEKIDLQIEEREQMMGSTKNKKTTNTDNENYIPPEILPKRK